MIYITVEDRTGITQEHEIPEDINLSLMEVLKACEYEVLATCGGMALCATCHVEVLDKEEKLLEPEDAELDMLDTLPDASASSRLACQIRINERLDGLKVRIKGALQ